ncbi:hypothetical protein GCM10008018_02020 [Paenibacillus marchantiophytorum]|uniref:Uncharacterized protein n=1 Tax=Paenibacillus marchantiophytorum TaxID=1619310 RepID=A0ABQ2BQ72_9BACL|nr:hypothetical protein GCM10008018_02020 [Paenibacillus marchantiophytorum]
MIPKPRARVIVDKYRRMNKPPSRLASHSMKEMNETNNLSLELGAADCFMHGNWRITYTFSGQFMVG